MAWVWASVLVRSAAILAAAWMLRRFLRGLSAKYRHSVLFAGFILLMLWPLLFGGAACDFYPGLASFFEPWNDYDPANDFLS